jgi:hypothetical protein
MKSIAKVLLVGAVAVMAIAMSAAPSEAAKKHHKAKAAMGCGDGGLCASTCSGSTCQVNFCGYDKQWHIALLTPICIQGQCPPKC